MVNPRLPEWPKISENPVTYDSLIITFRLYLFIPQICIAVCAVF